MESLKGQIAIITGAARGIGREIASVFAQEGAGLSLCDIDEDGIRIVSEELGKLYNKRVIWTKADVSNEENVKETVEKTIREFGKIDILVNNAGITKDNLLIRMSSEEWDSVIQVNLRSVFLFTRYSARYMIKQKRGKIVNISSVVGMVGNAGQANYAASKAGVIGFTKAASKELAARNITVNAIAPGYIETEMTKNLPDSVKENFKVNILLKKMGTVKDIAFAVKFLVSSEGDYITGQVIPVDGGLSI